MSLQEYPSCLQTIRVVNGQNTYLHPSTLLSTKIPIVPFIACAVGQDTFLTHKSIIDRAIFGPDRNIVILSNRSLHTTAKASIFSVHYSPVYHLRGYRFSGNLSSLC